MTSLNSCFCFSWCVIVVVFGSVLQNIQPQVTYQIILTFLLLPVAAVAPSIFFSLKRRKKGIEWVLLLLDLVLKRVFETF